MPIRSMTAYAAGERNTEWGVLGCEMRVAYVQDSIDNGRVKEETGAMLATEVANPMHIEKALKAGIDVLYRGDPV